MQVDEDEIPLTVLAVKPVFLLPQTLGNRAIVRLCHRRTLVRGSFQQPSPTEIAQNLSQCFGVKTGVRCDLLKRAWLQCAQGQEDLSFVVAEIFHRSCGWRCLLKI